MSELIKKLEAFRANLVGEDMNYRACLVDEAIKHVAGLEAEYKGFRDSASDTYRRLASERIALETAVREAVTYLNAIEIPDLAEEDRCIDVIRRLNAALPPVTYPYPHCRQKTVCAGKGSCPMDPSCGD